MGGKARKNAFIFGADATEATWEHIRAAYESKPDQVQAKCLVLSHHGSRQHGATNSAILNLIQPEVCFLSAGMHAGFKHPRADVVDLVRNLESMRTTTPHAISCFYEEDRTHKHMIKRTGRAIFSTFDHGLCEVNMGNGDEQDIEVQTALSMGKVYVYQSADAGAQEFVLSLNRMWHIEAPACVQQEEAAQAPPLTPEVKTLIAETFGCSPADLIFWQKESAQHIVPHPTHTMPAVAPEEQDPKDTEETPATTAAESQTAPSEAPAGKGKKRKRESDAAEDHLDIREVTSPSHFLARRNLLIKHGEPNEVIFALLDPVVRQGLHA